MPYINPPAKCDLCFAEITLEFYDCKTRMGPWANCCPACFQHFGLGLGVGRGQHFTRTSVHLNFEKASK